MYTPLESYPFLHEIPRLLMRTIDLSVLYVPSRGEHEIVAKLASDLDKNVVVYRRGVTSKGTHLCRVLQFAVLTQPELDALQTVEKFFSAGQVVVAYEKPLKIVNDQHRSS